MESDGVLSGNIVEMVWSVCKTRLADLDIKVGGSGELRDAEREDEACKELSRPGVREHRVVERVVVRL